jgi:hypothetical protein
MEPLRALRVLFDALPRRAWPRDCLDPDLAIAVSAVPGS